MQTYTELLKMKTRAGKKQHVIQMFNYTFQNLFQQHKITFYKYMQIFLGNFGNTHFKFNENVMVKHQFTIVGDSFLKIKFKRKVLNCRREMLM